MVIEDHSIDNCHLINYSPPFLNNLEKNITNKDIQYSQKQLFLPPPAKLSSPSYVDDVSLNQLLGVRNPFLLDNCDM